MRPYFLCLLAEACGETGHLDDGLSALTKALAAELQSQHEQRVIAHIGFEGRNQLLTLLDRLAELPCEPVK